MSGRFRASAPEAQETRRSRHLEVSRGRDMPAIQITAEIDFAADGKHADYLRGPHSSYRSAHGWIPVPVASIRNGGDPTVLLLASDQMRGRVTQLEGGDAAFQIARDAQPL